MYKRQSLQIDPRLIRCQTCVSAYIGAAFLCSGTVIDPQKEYNLEFLTSRTNLARDFEALLAEHEFAPHRTRRNGVNLIYVKTGANVEPVSYTHLDVYKRQAEYVGTCFRSRAAQGGAHPAQKFHDAKRL